MEYKKAFDKLPYRTVDCPPTPLKDQNYNRLEKRKARWAENLTGRRAAVRKALDLVRFSSKSDEEICKIVGVPLWVPATCREVLKQRQKEMQQHPKALIERKPVPHFALTSALAQAANLALFVEEGQEWLDRAKEANNGRLTRHRKALFLSKLQEEKYRRFWGVSCDLEKLFDFQDL